MKTLKKLFSGAMMVMFFAVLLTSCSDTPATIEIKQMPNATFEVGTTEINPLMVVKVGDTDGKTTDNVKLNYADGKVTSDPAGFEVTLNGFDLSKAGTFTASVEFGGAVSYFDYQVVAASNLFAGGDGSSKNPYQITTAQQLLNINSVKSTTDKHFKLMNDIDMSSVLENIVDKGWYGCFIKKSFWGTLDGNNKKIYNIDTFNKVNSKGNAYGEVVLFNSLYGATIKDLDLYVNAEYGFSITTDVYKTTNMTNVDMYGTMKSSHNHGNYCIYANRKSVISFKDCDSYVDNVASSANYIGAFVGYVINPYYTNYANKVVLGGKAASISFENCFNYGYLEALLVSTLVCNAPNSVPSDEENKCQVTVINSGNKGTLSSVDKLSNGYCATADNTIKIDSAHEQVILGNAKQLPKYNFAGNTKMDATTNKLMINKVAADSEIVKVKVTLSFNWMSYAGGTNSTYLSQEFAIGSEADVETQVYLADLQDGTPSIKIKMIADYTKAEGETEVTFKDCEWLKYNVEQKAYVFDGSKIDSNVYTTWGTPKISVLTYNANGDVVSASSVKITVK